MPRRELWQYKADMILALVLACSPAMPTSQTFAGPGVSLRQTIKRPTNRLELLVGTSVRWTLETTTSLFRPLFRDDGRYLAEARTTNAASVSLFGPDGQERELSPLSLLTDDERDVMGETSCGPNWFGGLRFEGESLVVLINQAPMRRPTEAPDPTPKLEVLVDLQTGTLRRRTPPKVVTSAGLIDTFRKHDDQQPKALEGLMLKANRARGGGDATLRAFVLEELPKSTDPQTQEGLLFILEAVALPTDQDWVMAHALEAQWPLEAVWRILSRPELLHRLALQISEGRLGTPNSRRFAVEALAPTPEGPRAVRLGLEDPTQYVRESTEHCLASLTPSEESFAMTLARIDRPVPRGVMVQRFFARERPADPPNPWAARFEQACEGAMRRAWPGCDVWTGALAETRGNLGLARARYERALAPMTVEHEHQTVWSGEVDTYFRLRVRLALLAKAENHPAVVKAHVGAMKRSRWLRHAHVECSTALPRELTPDCERVWDLDALLEKLVAP